MVQKIRKAKPKQKQGKQEKNKISKYIKKGPKNKEVQRDNTYVFEGFYQKLKQIDVKQAHSTGSMIDTNFGTYGLMQRSNEEEEEMFVSNFIQYMRAEKANNKSHDFGIIYKNLEQYCFSYPLLVHNRALVVNKLLHYLSPESPQQSKVAQIAIIELLIALIKDFRADIYEEFTQRIMPQVISSCLDIRNVDLLDKAFTLISFGVKYLSKSIKQDFERFYEIYFELLIHSNKFVRKFASQSLSYVIRKLDINSSLMKTLIKPLVASHSEELINEEEQILDQSQNQLGEAIELQWKIEQKSDLEKIAGLCDLFYEIAYGAAEGLHSIANEVLSQLLNEIFSHNFNTIKERALTSTFLRFLFAKLINEIDTEKQKPILDVLFTTINIQSEHQLNLDMLVIKDLVKLKFGRRINSSSTVVIYNYFDKLLKQKSLAVIHDFSFATFRNITETIMTFYYFKHSHLQQNGLLRSITEREHKDIFNSGIYKLFEQTTNPLQVMKQCYLPFAVENSQEINCESDLDFQNVIGLKVPSQAKFEIYFSDESHRSKLKLLLRSMTNYVLKQLKSKDHINDTKVEFISLLLIVIQSSKENPIILLNQELQQALCRILDNKSNIDELKLFIILKFLTQCQLEDKSQNLLGEYLSKIEINNYIDDSDESEVGSIKSDQIQSNFVLKNYKLNSSKMSELKMGINQMIDRINTGASSPIKKIEYILKNSLTQLIDRRQDNIKTETVNLQDIVVLRLFNKNKTEKYDLSTEDGQKLFQSLSSNLMKNQRELRLETLIALTTKFKPLPYTKTNSEESKENQISHVYQGDCKVLDFMRECEEFEIGFEKEKAKQIKIKTLQTQVESGSIPTEYLEAVFNYLVGCFWVKFTPLFDSVQEALASVVNQDLSKYGPRLITMLENTSYLSTLAPDNDQLIEKLRREGSESLSEIAYARESSLNGEFMEVKDVFYNLSKTLQYVIDDIIKSDLKGDLFQVIYDFIDCEFNFLHQGSRVQNQTSQNENKEKALIDQLTTANMIESDYYKSYRRGAFSKLYAFVELLTKSTNLSTIPRVEDLQVLLNDLLSSSDPKLQKMALDCLIKTGYKNGLLKHYRKLLEGLADDAQFKDMIQVITFGSKGGKQEKMADESDEEQIAQKKKQDKTSSIAKLDDAHRQDILPIIVKLLLSKLIKKKGAINNKSIHARRNIVFGFMGSLDPMTELHFFISEILQPLGLDLLLTEGKVKNDMIKEKLSRVGFTKYLDYINSMSIVIKQMGSLLINGKEYINILTKGLIFALSLTKVFIKEVKESKVEQREQEKLMDEDSDSEDSINVQEVPNLPQVSSPSDDSDSSSQETGNAGQRELYRYVGQQSKSCLRKGLLLVKQIYIRFGKSNEQYNQLLSKLFYAELVEDQLDLLPTNYITDKSSLVEIMTQIWSTQSSATLENYLNFQKCLPKVLEMLASKKISFEVASLILDMLKSFIMKSIQGQEDKKELFFNIQYQSRHRKQEEDDDEETLEDQEQIKQEREITIQILKTFSTDISSNLNQYCQNHMQQIKQALTKKQKNFKQQKAQMMKLGGKVKDQGISQQTVRDLVFIMSELSTYLQPNDPLNQGFLDMTVMVVLIQSQSDSYDPSGLSEELLYSGCKAITNLLSTAQLDTTSEDLLLKIFQIFLHLKFIRVRQSFSQDLQKALCQHQQKQTPQKKSKVKEVSIKMKEDVVNLIAGLNKIKRGAADLTIDYDSAIQSIGLASKLDLGSLTGLEIFAITVSILFLLDNEEYSVRDYASHFIKQLLTFIQTKQTHTYAKLLTTIEKTIINQMRQCKDEMILKTILETLRSLIQFSSNCHIKTFEVTVEKPWQSENQLESLECLVNFNDENDDFFLRFLSIKLKQRSKALKSLISKLLSGMLNNTKSFQNVILPLINYILFGLRAQKQNRRGQVSYSSQERRALTDDALNVYEALAKTLKWSDYYKLLKQLLHRLNKISQKAHLVGHDKADDLEIEKIITKSICKILNGLHFDVPDAVVEIEKAYQNTQQQNQDKDFQAVFKDLLVKHLPKPQAQLDQDAAIVDEAESSSDEEDVKEDVKMEDIKQGQKSSEHIQKILLSKVLPILERHLTDKGDEEEEHHVRSFAVSSIVRTIRKLSLDQFELSLSKLINTIITKGLRSKHLTSREKARKALVKILVEVSPRFIPQVFQQMADLLTRGYQVQTQLYSVHFILQRLQEKKILKAGDVTNHIIDVTAPKLLDDLFGNLKSDLSSNNQNQVEDEQKNKVKEAKGHRAIPVFELYAQFINFEQSFLHLIGYVIRGLEGNPNIGRIAQCEELLFKMSSSLLKNESLKGEQLLMFVYSLIERGVTQATKVKVNDAKAKRDYGAKTHRENEYLKTKQEYKEMTYKVEARWLKGNQTLGNKKIEEVTGRVLATFGLMCLKKALKNKGLILASSGEELSLADDQNPLDIKEELKARLDPFVPLLLHSFKTYHNPIIVSTLHILGTLLGLGLPSFKELLKKFLNKIFKLFEQTSTSSDSDFINSLFKCTSELIRFYAVQTNELSQVQLKTLVSIIKQYLTPNNINTFHCLRSLIQRKFVFSEIYDIIDEQIQDILITSINRNVRTVCSSILISFIIDYPLEKTRLQQHINYLLKNVGTYFDSEGRLQILEVLSGLAEKMPREVLDSYAELVFFTLMLRTVNETNKLCRDKVSNTLKRLIIKLSPNKARSIFNTVTSMNSSEPSKKQVLEQAKLIILGIYIDSQTIKSSQDISKLLQEVFIPILQEHSSKLERAHKKRTQRDSEDERDDLDEVKNPDMQKFLQGIDLIDSKEQKPSNKNGLMQVDLFGEDQGESSKEWSAVYYSFENIERLLLKEDQRKSVFQILGKQEGFIEMVIRFCISHNALLVRMIAQRVMRQITKLDQNDLKQTKVILGQKQESIAKMFSFYLNSFKTLPMPKELGEIIAENSLNFLKVVLNDDNSNLDLTPIFIKASVIGRKMMLNIQQALERLEFLLQFFENALTYILSLDQSQFLLQQTCEPILQLIFRLYTDDQYNNTAAKTSSITIMDLFSNNLDKDVFMKIYNQVKQSIEEKRSERKRQQKLLMASEVGYEVKQKKRLKKMEKKKEQKKHKILMYELKKK